MLMGGLDQVKYTETNYRDNICHSPRPDWIELKTN